MARWQVGERVFYQHGARSFEVEEILSGGMGVVYIVTDVETGDPFVVKTIRDQLTTHPELVARFRREVEAWMMLEKHPNIVQARGFELLDGKPHLMLEYVSGGSLRDLFGHEELDIPDVLDLTIQVARGMRYAGSKGVTAHRDLKPDNILMTANRVAKVTDFGLVKLFAAQELDEVNGDFSEETPSLRLQGPLTTAGGRGMGTKDYMSPEQWRNAGEADIRSDVYSFGVMMYEMLTRIRPFFGKTRAELRNQHLSHTPVPPSALRPDVLPAVDAFVARCIAKHPSDRFQTFAEVEQELTRILQKDYRRVVKLATTDQLTLAEMNERGAAFFNLGKHPQALACFDEVLRLDTDYALAWANRGVALAELNRFDDALVSFDRSLQSTPDSPVVLMNKGLTLAELGRLDEAHLCLDQAVRLNPFLQDAWRFRAELLNRLGWSELAYYSAYKARQLNPADERVYSQEVAALLRMGQLDRAAEVVSTWERLVGNKAPELLLLRARLARAQDNLRHALLLSAAVPGEAPEYRDALRLGMECALTLDYMDEVAIHSTDLLKAGFGADALAMILEALDERGPLLPIELVVLACEVAARVGNFVAAKHLYAAWLRYGENPAGFRGTASQGPQIPMAVLRGWRSVEPAHETALGVLLAYLNRPRTAVRHLRKGLEALPDDLEGWQVLAEVCNELSDSAGALAAAEQVARLDPDNQQTWLTLAEAALRHGAFDQALHAAQKAHTIGRETALSLFLYGAALAGQGRHHLAVRHFERAISLDGRLSVAWWNQCLCLWQLRRPEEARRAMILARTLDARMWEHAPYETPPFLPYPLSKSSYLDR
jgi:serine/threonine protein kinase